MNPEWFFPERGQSHRPGKEVCAMCPVVLECEEYRSRSGSEYGMWGGAMTKRKRRESTATDTPPAKTG